MLRPPLTTSLHPSRTNWTISRHVPLIALTLAGLLALALIPNLPNVRAYHNFAVDWNIFVRATTLLRTTGNPYLEPEFYNPPWLLIPLLPLSYLPPQTAFTIWFVLSFTGYALLAYKLRAHPLTLIAGLLSYPVLQGLLLGQVDWLILLGMFLPRPLGFLVLATKPQISVGILLLWLYEAGRDTDKTSLLRLLAPTTLAYTLALVFYGLPDLPTHADHNLSIWPYGIVPGLFILAHAIRQGQDKRNKPGLLASPLLAPFLSVQSWGNIMFTLPPAWAVTFSILSYIIGYVLAH